MSIQYQDLEVEVSRCLCGKLEVRVLSSPFDRPRERFKLPFKQEKLKKLLGDLDDLILSGKKRDRARLSELAENLGERLFKCLFRGGIRNTLDRCLAEVDASRGEEPRKGLRIRVSFGEASRYLPEVVSLPWELLRNPEDARYLSRRASVQVVRYLDSATRIQPLRTEAPLKVLFVLSSPKDQPEIDVTTSQEALDKIFANQPWIEHRFLAPPTLARLREVLAKERFHGLHFLGHGGFLDGGEGVLCFERSNRSTHEVSGTRLASQLENSSDLRFVVLTACVGAQMLRRKGQHPFTGAASALVTGGIPAVVAMQLPISEEAASQFSGAFYQSLSENHPVDLAMAEARLRLAVADSTVAPFEWLSPVLIMRTPDGHLLDLRETDEPAPKVIAIFNQRDHGKEEAEHTDRRVDLVKFFKKDGRTIKDPAHWNGGVMNGLKRVFNSTLGQRVSYHLIFAAPASVAFATGWLLPEKSGRKLSFSQRSVKQTQKWDLTEPTPEEAATWIPAEESDRSLPEKLPITKRAQDIAVAVSIAQPSLEGVLAYLKNSEAKPPRVRRVLHAEIPNPGGTKIENGSHALELAEQLRNRIHSDGSALPEGTIHLFIAAPNVFTFFLGRASEFLGRIQLYEWDRDRKTYLPSISLQFAD